MKKTRFNEHRIMSILKSADGGVALAYIQSGKPQQNAYVERYNQAVRHEWLGQNQFTSIKRVARLGNKLALDL